MKKEKLRYNKIKKFLDELNTREKNYIKRKLIEELSETEAEQVEFTIVIDGKIIV